ncbi:MAG: hypothetical protein JRH11_04525 [Deltaproteobacteria bacterium]|nr:hypothetical protein [Deltaproteobacteria bacterium]
MERYHASERAPNDRKKDTTPVGNGSGPGLQITEGIGSGNGMVVYWNGNGSVGGPLTDWNTTAATPTALQNLFVNTIEYLCATP